MRKVMLLVLFGLLAAVSSAQPAAAQTFPHPWAWGDNTYGQLGDGTNTDRNKPVQVINLSGVRAIAAGSNHSLAAAQ